MRDASNMTAPLGFFTWLSRWSERRRRQKAIQMRLATVLTLVLKFPVTTALLYGQEVHYNYERGANFSAYKTYQWVDTPAAAPKSDPASAPKADAGGPPNLPALPNLPAPLLPPPRRPTKLSGRRIRHPGQCIRGSVDQPGDQAGNRRAARSKRSYQGRQKRGPSGGLPRCHSTGTEPVSIGHGMGRQRFGRHVGRLSARPDFQRSGRYDSRGPV